MTKENLYNAWNDFIRGKRKRPDVNVFAMRLSDNLSELHGDLVKEKYIHGPYEEYMICDPKKRIIHKASVRDRVAHRLVYNALYPYFDTKFVYDSYSCRVGKGTHKARERFRRFANQISANYTKQCYVLKFDIQKCFASVDQEILKCILRAHIEDTKFLNFLYEVVDSFKTGFPLGNLTSQLFINIYLHELDYFVKHTLRVQKYIRYADDIVIVHESPKYLEQMFISTNVFLTNKLHLTTHKVQIRSIYGGVDVLGEVFFAEYKRLRRSTERRTKIRDSLKK